MGKYSEHHSRSPVAVIGGGIIGLATAWQLAKRGADVSLFERHTTGRGASWVAAGMLAPLSEVGFEDEDFLRIGRESLSLYPRFLDELKKDSDSEVVLDTRGTLMIGLDRDDAERLRRLHVFREQLGLPVKWLSGTEAREIEPLISPRTSSAIWIPDDHQVNNQALVDALKIAFEKCGGTLYENRPVSAIQTDNGRATGVLNDDGDVKATSVIVAAGCWSRKLNGIPKELLPPVRPVKGQIITLRSDGTYELSHVVRAPDAYLLPKGDGRVLLGASEEEMGFDTTITAGPIYKLLERGWEAVPSIYDLEVEKIEAGLRPGSRDHDPIVGETSIEGLYYATGHYRHGILLAPITAYEMSGLILDGRSSELFAPFKPGRFVPPGKQSAVS
ncbi:MAG: glycine oxidase ThiO [Candidatus Latescibacteria bacterium]|nr:glycine oxidase ThiO [Candidatus Latescibacterota bacterium]NIM21802.1 glycine oxidase ThiO [Candidatus Latescibacterota bacterium]NIM65940.1 glycine oxidase ThiO [Candidatus Latescibacterota bacterium]NIO02685.1 glycine oxidase ThiO [Candidatus Latescibacterota bacterium]NIO29666.1 glycine oxidase ThiO [Candidatus Latescibacterota bacterium]